MSAWLARASETEEALITKTISTYCNVASVVAQAWLTKSFKSVPHATALEQQIIMNVWPVMVMGWWKRLHPVRNAC